MMLEHHVSSDDSGVCEQPERPCVRRASGPSLTREKAFRRKKEWQIDAPRTGRKSRESCGICRRFEEKNVFGRYLTGRGTT